MTILDFIQSIKDGKVSFNWNGHNSSYDKPMKSEYAINQFKQYGTSIRAECIYRFVESLESSIGLIFDMAERYVPAEGVKSTPEEIARMQEWYKKDVERIRTMDVKFPTIYLVFGTTEYHCFSCGKRLIFRANSPTDVQVIEHRYHNPENKWLGGKFIPDDSPCPFKDGVPPTEAVINVPTGRLVFVNFFGNYEEHDPKREHEYSLNHDAGRMKLAEYYATKHNIGFGQMGNMSVGVYCNKQTNRIWIATPYDPKEQEILQEGEKGYEEWKKECEQFDEMTVKNKAKFRGSISCEVWRWMCCDAKFIDKKYWKPKDYSDDPIVVRVQPGRYKIRHMYRSDTEHSEVVYSTLERIE